MKHMYINVEHHSVFEALLTDDSNHDLLVAFRRGEFGTFPQPTGHSSDKRRAPRAFDTLSAMYARIDRRSRDMLLRYVRHEGGCGAAFVASCEFIFQVLLDGGGEAAAVGAFDSRMVDIVLQTPVWDAAACGMAVTFHLADGFHRVLVEGLARFYGLCSSTWEESGPDGDSRCVRVVCSNTCDETPLDGPAHELHDLRRRLCSARGDPELLGRTNSIMERRDSSLLGPSAASALIAKADLPRAPVFPLFLAYVRSIDESKPARPTAPSGRRRRG